MFRKNHVVETYDLDPDDDQLDYPWDYEDNDIDGQEFYDPGEWVDGDENYSQSVGVDLYQDEWGVIAEASLDVHWQPPWPAILYGITLAACLALGGLLYLFSASFSYTGQTVVPSSVEEADPNQVNAEFTVDENQNEDPGGECRLSAGFPQKIQQWCGLITKHAEKRGLPPDLVAALILQESGGNPDAYSHSGAVGLMQVMPSDGLAASFICANGPCFADRPSAAELYDPSFNISYGTKMLAGLVNKTGSYREALKSYGPMNVGYYYADIVLRLFERYGVN